MNEQKPKALIVDDDIVHQQILDAVLRKLGFDTVVCNSSIEFVKLLKQENPSLCIVDLNIEQLGSGFMIVQAVRKVMGHAIPIIVVSGVYHNDAVLRALELGANDFIVKPIDRTILATKITRFVKTDALLGAKANLYNLPDGGASAEIALKFKLCEIYEDGVLLSGPNLLTKNVSFYFDSTLFHRITGFAHPFLVTVVDGRMDPQTKIYTHYCRFTQVSSEFLGAIRKFLANNAQAKKQPLAPSAQSSVAAQNNVAAQKSATVQKSGFIQNSTNIKPKKIA